MRRFVTVTLLGMAALTACGGEVKSPATSASTTSPAPSAATSSITTSSTNSSPSASDSSTADDELLDALAKVHPGLAEDRVIKQADQVCTDFYDKRSKNEIEDRAFQLLTSGNSEDLTAEQAKIAVAVIKSTVCPDAPAALDKRTNDSTKLYSPPVEIAGTACQDARNELDRTGLTPLLDKALRGEEALAIEFSAPVNAYERVPVIGADEKSAAAVSNLNAAISALKIEGWSTWTDEQTTALGSAYSTVQAVCADA